MKCDIIIDPDCEERVTIYAKELTPTVRELQRIAENAHRGLMGYREGEMAPLNPAEICCITVTGGKVYALCRNGTWQLKERLYTLEEILPSHFLKINQSCLANIRQIQKFDTSLSGTLKVVFRNGHTDYVSRRQLKHVKERMGI